MYHLPYYGQEYRQQDVLGASPIRLVVMAYDLAIRSCEQKDFPRAIKAVTALRDTLNFDYPEVSVGLFRLYQWCLDCIRQNDYENALHTLRELREAWAITEKKMTAAQSQPSPAFYRSVGRAG